MTAVRTKEITATISGWAYHCAMVKGGQAVPMMRARLHASRPNQKAVYAIQTLTRSYSIEGLGWTQLVICRIAKAKQ